MPFIFWDARASRNIRIDSLIYGLIRDVIKCWLVEAGRVKHKCVDNVTIIGSDNGLLLGRRQAIIWANAWIVLIGHLWTNFSGIFNRNPYIFIQENAFEKIVCQMTAISLGLTVLTDSNIEAWWHICSPMNSIITWSDDSLPGANPLCETVQSNFSWITKSTLEWNLYQIRTIVYGNMCVRKCYLWNAGHFCAPMGYYV